RTIFSSEHSKRDFSAMDNNLPGVTSPIGGSLYGPRKPLWPLIALYFDRQPRSMSRPYAEVTAVIHRSAACRGLAIKALLAGSDNGLASSLQKCRSVNINTYISIRYIDIPGSMNTKIH